MLNVEKLHQYYGGSHILRGLSFEVKVGEVTCLLGRNGVGKTTLLKCLMGLLPVKEGSVQWEGQPITTLKPHQRVHAGIAYVPQGREIFGRLTVEENLLMGLSRFPGAEAREVPAFIYELFPVLLQMKHRRGGDLSGGQQQQLAIGRALASRPRLLILDDKTIEDVRVYGLPVRTYPLYLAFLGDVDGAVLLGQDQVFLIICHDMLLLIFGILSGFYCIMTKGKLQQ